MSLFGVILSAYILLSPFPDAFYQLRKLFFTFRFGWRVDVVGGSFAVYDRRVTSFPHVLADLMDRACSLTSVLALIRLKFRPWRGFWYFGRCLLVLVLTALKLGVRACKRSYSSVYAPWRSVQRWIGKRNTYSVGRTQ